MSILAFTKDLFMPARTEVTVMRRDHKFGPQWFAVFPDGDELAWFDCLNLRAVLETAIRRGRAAQAILNHLEKP